MTSARGGNGSLRGPIGLRCGVKPARVRALGFLGPRRWGVCQDNRGRLSVLIPEVGWVQIKRSLALAEWWSYRITRNSAGCWHVAFTVVLDPIPAPGTGGVVGVDCGITLAMALSTGEMRSPAGSATGGS